MLSDRSKSVDRLVIYYRAFFEIGVESNVQTFFGFTVQHCDKSSNFCNAAMIARMLRTYRMQDCKQVETPLFEGLHLANDECKSLTNATPYSRLIGSVLCLAYIVRSDIVFPVDYLSRFMHTPAEMLSKAERYVLRYLRRTQEN